MRAGLNEMRSLSEDMYPTVRDGTFFESCGVADLIATCYGAHSPSVCRSEGYFPDQRLLWPNPCNILHRTVSSAV